MSRPQTDAAVDDLIAGIFVEKANEFPCVIVDGVLPSLKSIDLFDHGNGNDDVVVFEMKNRVGIVEDDVGI